MLRSKVGGKAQLPKLLPADMTLHLVCLLGRPVISIHSGQVSVFRQAGTVTAWEEHHHLGLGVISFQAGVTSLRAP